MKSFTIGLSGGGANSLDEAKAAFRAAWQRPLSQKIADDMLNLSLSGHDPGRVKTRARLITAEVSDSSSAQSSAACVLDPAYTTR